MNVETDDPDHHRIHVNTRRGRGGKLTICEYLSPTPGELVAGPTTRIVLSRDEALRLADALVDSIEYHDNRRPAAAPLRLAITVDVERGPTRRTRQSHRGNQ